MDCRIDGDEEDPIAFGHESPESATWPEARSSGRGAEGAQEDGCGRQHVVRSIDRWGYGQQAHAEESTPLTSRQVRESPSGGPHRGVSEQVISTLLRIFMRSALVTAGVATSLHPLMMS